MKKEAALLLEVSEKSLEEFEAIDTFNNNNKLVGVKCMRRDYRYGALVIFKVNDEELCQVIYGTPKLHYPFDKHGQFRWPKIEKVEVWDKLDGTNILSYRYRYQGKEFITFKTRLTPVVVDGTFGSFCLMWEEYYNKNSWIKIVIDQHPECNLSFELFGSRNPITITYKVPLDVNLLFGVNRETADVITPTTLHVVDGVKYPKHHPVSSKLDLTDYYNNTRKKMSEINNSGEEEFSVEGMVFYAKCENESSWRQFKCKPEEIEKIHWANGGIGKLQLRNTAINCFESSDDVTIEDFIILLKEEYTDAQIDRCRERLSRILGEVKEHLRIVKTINQVWKLANDAGFDITKDKAGTFRFMSKHFKKSEMKKVGTIILKQAGLLKKGRTNETYCHSKH